jgi:hypothetical protein
MTVPHRNDVPGLASRCPDQHDKTVRQQPVGEKAILAIVEAVIALRQRRPCENQARVGEIKAAHVARFVSFGWVKSNLHRLP